MSGPVDAESRELLTPAEAAVLAAVDPDTLARWANQGRLSVQKTAGGHRRYRRDELLQLIETS